MREKRLDRCAGTQCHAAKQRKLGRTCFRDDLAGNVGTFLAGNRPQKTANMQ